MLLSFTATIGYGMILFRPLIRWADTSEVIFHSVYLCATLWEPILRTVIPKPDVTQPQGMQEKKQ